MRFQFPNETTHSYKNISEKCIDGAGAYLAAGQPAGVDTAGRGDWADTTAGASASSTAALGWTNMSVQASFSIAFDIGKGRAALLVG
jgi:hypothetical protein